MKPEIAASASAMRSLVVVTSVLVLSAAQGCKSCGKTARPPDRDEAGAAEVRIGDDDDTQPRVGFSIEHVYEKQKTTDATPWHAAGGEWTFFDARLSDGTRFGFGFTSGKAAGSVTFADGMLTVDNADEGARMVAALAHAFHGKVPPPRERTPLRIAPISLAVLRTSAARGANGFEGEGGWMATKLFLQRTGIEAEIFFNFNIGSKKGEFAEKDADYANDVVAFAALELRDGPRPARTAADDPQISATGPVVGAWRVLVPGTAELLFFERDEKRVMCTIVEKGVTRVSTIAIDDPNDAVEIARTDAHLDSFRCAAHADVCVMQELRPKKPNVISSDDPKSFFLVDRRQKTKRALAQVTTTDATLAEEPLAPDGSFVAVEEWHDNAKGPGKYTVHHFVATKGEGPGATADLGEKSSGVVGWQGEGPALRAVVRIGATWKREPLTYELVDPRTGKRSPLATAPAAIPDKATSPDGKHRVTCEATTAIVVSDVGTGTQERFRIHPDDAAALGDCVSWTSPRYLFYPTDRIGLIDITTMKLSYPFAGERPPGLSFSPEMRWAVSTTKEGLRIARVTTP